MQFACALNPKWPHRGAFTFHTPDNFYKSSLYYLYCFEYRDTSHMHMHMHMYLTSAHDMCMCMHMYMCMCMCMWRTCGEARPHSVHSPRLTHSHTESGLLHSTLYFTHNVHTFFRAPRVLRITDHAHLFC